MIALHSQFASLAFPILLRNDEDQKDGRRKCYGPGPDLCATFGASLSGPRVATETNDYHASQQVDTWAT